MSQGRSFTHILIMPILRVFQRKTKATEDEYVAIGSPGLFAHDDISEIHISVTFTWDLKEAEALAEQWSRYGNGRNPLLC